MPKSARDYLKIEPCGVDQREFPRWGKDCFGDPVRIKPDDQLREEFDKWMSEACQHPSMGIAEWRDAQGATCFTWLCRNCAKRLSENINHVEGREASSGQVERADILEKRDAYRAKRKKDLDKILFAAVCRA